MSENKQKRGLFGRPQQSAGENVRHETQKAPRPRKKGRAGRIIGTILLVMVLTVIIFTGIFMTWINTSLKGHVEVYLDELETRVSTELYYLDAQSDEWVMYQTLYDEGENRIRVTLSEIPKYLQDAAVAIEDKRFETHHGVDLRGTVRAIVSTLTGRGVQGGSTITQQLIKNATGDSETTVKRKVTEIYRALELEKRYDKDQILEAYLNRIYLGQSCYGVEAASRTYFGKSVSELTLAQCASLIAITNNPSQFGPFESEWSREQNRDRQLLVLEAMLEQGKISQQEYDAAKAEEVVFVNGYSNTGNYYGDAVVAASDQADEPAEEAVATATYKARNSYFTDALIEDVIEALMDEFGYDYATATKALFNKGYKIYTTQNHEYQKIAERVFEDLNNTPYTRTNSKGETEQLQGAISVIDPYTGYVVAMVGGTGAKTTDRGWNWATSVRPCGSAAKPISTYAPALDRGVITAASTIDDYPVLMLNDTPYPKNDNGRFQGLTTMRRALVQSLNTCAVRVCMQLSTWESYDFMTSKLGFTTLTQSDSEQVGAMALGGYARGVTTEEMAAAYGAFVNEGIYTKPRTFIRVEDNAGNVILENDIQSNVAMKASTAALMNSVLQDVVSWGTGSAANFEGMTLAGKTGTTNDLKDRYFVGYSPYYVAACWVGYESNSRVSSGGVNPAVALWKNVMSQIHAGLEKKSFFSCADLVQVSVCSDSGMLATEQCQMDPRGSRVRTEWVAVDNQPGGMCTMHNGGGMLDYTRDYFAGYPDLVAEDSEYVHWGNPIGGDEYSTPPGGYGDSNDDSTTDDTQGGNTTDDVTGDTAGGNTADGGGDNGTTGDTGRDDDLAGLLGRLYTDLTGVLTLAG